MIDKIEDIDKEDLTQTLVSISVIMGAFCISYSELNSPLAMSVAKLGQEKSMKIFSSNVENNVKDLISKVDITNYFSIQDFYDRNIEKINSIIEINLKKICDNAEGSDFLFITKFLKI